MPESKCRLFALCQEFSAAEEALDLAVSRGDDEPDGERDRVDDAANAILDFIRRGDRCAGA